MPLTYHPEYYAAIEPLIPAMAAMPKAPRHDTQTRRHRLKTAFEPLFNAAAPKVSDVTSKIWPIKSYDDYEVLVTRYTKTDITPGPAVLFIHSGGLIAGDVEMFDKTVRHRVSRSDIQFFSVQYRLAPEHRFPAAIEDCYAALLWLHNSAETFNIDPARIVVWGESAGGGLAAALTILARDRKLSPPIKKQILIYPMLDDRNVVPNPELEPLTTWTIEDNITGWSAYLDRDVSSESSSSSLSSTSPTSPYASPARVESVVGLPQAYIEVGSLDNFRDEDILYATRLLQANINVGFHLIDGVPHAFEALAPGSTPAKLAVENRLAALVGV